jgi:hypothetical protein
MKASEFKEIIKEAVREAIQEELKTILSEAVHTPKSSVSSPAFESVYQAPKQQPLQFTSGNPLMEALNMTSRAMTSEDYQSGNTQSPSTVRANMSEMFAGSSYSAKPTYKPVSEDHRAVASAIAAAPKVGLDLSQLGFVNKAAAIVKLADKKSQPYGF